MASFSNKSRMLDEVASIEEMSLIQLPDMRKRGTLSNGIVDRVCIRVRLFPYLVEGDDKKNKLSMIFGVTLPCILSIFSVILFLRLGLTVGQIRTCFLASQQCRNGWLARLVMLLNEKSIN